LLGSGVDNHNASNNPIAAAGNRILFVAQHDQTGDNIFFGAGTTSSSIEAIEVDGKAFTTHSTGSNPSSAKDGAWLAGHSGLIFTDGTTDGTYKALGKEINTYGKAGIVNDRPWFTADYSGRNERTLGIWRALPLDEWSPTRPILLKPESKSVSGSVAPKFFWEKVVNTDSYHLQISELNDFLNLYILMKLLKIQHSYSLIHWLLLPNTSGEYALKMRILLENGVMFIPSQLY